MFHPSVKGMRRLSWLLLVMLCAVLLAGCSEELQTPTQEPVQSQALAPAPTATVAVDTPTPDPTLPPPTRAFVEPTVTPLSSPSPLPSMGSAGSTNPGTSADGPSDSGDLGSVDNLPEPTPVARSAQGGGSLFGMKLEDVPLQNGLPRLPVIKASTGSSQPTPKLKANFGSNNNPKVGIQAGHWLIASLPDELASLRSQTGGSGGGVSEVDFNLDVARRVAALLKAKGIEVDLLPATVPVNYTADAFVAIHADAVTGGGGPGGFKLARSRFSPIPFTDDALMNSIYSTYGKATAMRRDDNITRNMTGYYAFNNRRRNYAVSKVTPAVIIETGYLTNSNDVSYMISHKDQIAGGIADGILNFLNNRPPLDSREKPQVTTAGIEIQHDNTVVLDKPNGAPIAYLSKGSQFEYFELKDGFYSVRLPILNKTGYIARADGVSIQLPR
ncbi:MAG TPA: N-acetylmuramoyl-L-alanine amidase [Chloroflexia bacterium]|nr:N-acetylmuramoyl-L-alanine amidase [Chloroflexia bacterium]